MYCVCQFQPIPPKSNICGKGLHSSGLYYKHMTIANDDSSVVNTFGASLTDNARVVIYECRMFIVQATASCNL